MLSQRLCVVTLAWPWTVGLVGAEADDVAADAQEAACWRWRNALAVSGPCLAVMLLVHTADAFHVTKLPKSVLQGIVRRIPRHICTAKELGLMVEVLVRHPVHILLTLCLHAGGRSRPQSLWTNVKERVATHGVGSMLWAGVAPMCLAVLLGNAWVRPLAHGVLALLSVRSRAGRMLVFAGVRLSLAALLQPLMVVSRHMVLTNKGAGDTVRAIVQRRGPLGFFAGLAWREGHLAIVVFANIGFAALTSRSSRSSM